MSSVRRRAVAAALLLASFIAPVRATAQAAPFCAPKLFRWQENCVPAPGAALPGGLDSLRYVPLTADRSLWLTLGGEYRGELERLDGVAFGLGPKKSYTARDQRMLLHADLHHRSGVRVFVQLAYASSSGREPVTRPFDRTGVDVAQAFVDLPVKWSRGTLTARLGRQELDSGGNRLIAIRDAANLRRAFDMVLLEYRDRSDIRVSAFGGRPVLNKPGAFDDEGDKSETFFGVMSSLPWSAGSARGSAGLDFLRRKRDRAVFFDGVAPEDRSTLCAIANGGNGRVTFETQGAYQWGTFGKGNIRAWGLAGEVARVFAEHPIRPTAGITFGIASGDRRQGDQTLNTFDVVYPNLGYFSDAPVFFPGNTWDARPLLTLTPIRALSVQFGADFIFRLSGHDAVYQPPGVPLVRPVASPGSSEAVLYSAKATFAPSQHIQFLFSYVHGSPRAVLNAAGARTFDYGLATLKLQF